MFSVFLQNLVLILVTLLILFNHKADYTLFMAIAAIFFTSFRIMFMHGSNSTKINYFLIQSFIFRWLSGMCYSRDSITICLSKPHFSNQGS